MAKKSVPRRGETAAWAVALRRAAYEIETRGPDKGQRRLDLIARQVVKLAMAGDLGAVQEIANRLDGRPVPVEPVPDAPQVVTYFWGGVRDDAAPDTETLPAGDPVGRLR
jgi:hypothetical protein